MSSHEEHVPDMVTGKEGNANAGMMLLLMTTKADRSNGDTVERLVNGTFTLDELMEQVCHLSALMATTQVVIGAYREALAEKYGVVISEIEAEQVPNDVTIEEKVREKQAELELRRAGLKREVRDDHED